VTEAAATSRSRGARRWVVLALTFYLVFIAAAAPGTVAAWALAVATKGAARMEAPRGSFWSGHADALVIGRPTDPLRYVNFDWAWLGTRMIDGEFVFRLRIADPRLSGTVYVAPQLDRVRLENARLTFSASLLTEYDPYLMSGGLSGLISLESSEFTIGNGSYHGEATLRWPKLKSSLTGSATLGSYQAIISGVGKRTEFRIKTIDGMLHLNGKGAWALNEGLAFDGWARADGQARALDQLLRQLGRDIGNGAFHLQLPSLS